ncbi:hypothetical protein IMZ11_32895 [Microtetraspora sp. AC03309]|uniref:hypothetical protein n=1 Tax=Microtetraspora sp. AC03309 TaxID=2779376 RepID=UPI001E2EC129|nr:hypothetical protein [Microtetraspora sp. AC03309]MCC5580427.1 hypothetical protein [Microtetraspora sp. AC03309]
MAAAVRRSRRRCAHRRRSGSGGRAARTAGVGGPARGERLRGTAGLSALHRALRVLRHPVRSRPRSGAGSRTGDGVCGRDGGGTGGGIRAARSGFIGAARVSGGGNPGAGSVGTPIGNIGASKDLGSTRLRHL